MTYKQRKRAGLVAPRPRRTTAEMRREIRRKYFVFRVRQVELAREYQLSQSTIARVIANEALWKPTHE